MRNSGKINSLKNCVISSNGTYGLYCSEGGSVVMTGCTLSKNTNDGARITGDGSNAKISDCVILENLANGIVVIETAKISSLQDVTVTDNGKHGIAVYKNSAIQGVTGTINATGNGGNQVYVEAGADTDLTTQKTDYVQTF